MSEYTDSALDAIALVECAVSGDTVAAGQVLKDCDPLWVINHLTGLVRALLLDRDPVDPWAPLASWREYFLEREGADCD